MAKKVFATAVVDGVENGVVQIIAGKTYEVTFDPDSVFFGDDCGWITTETGDGAFILFEHCAWQGGKNWIIEVLEDDK